MPITSAVSSAVNSNLFIRLALQRLGVTAVQSVEVLRDRISLTCGTSLLSRQLDCVGEVRKPRHLDPPFSTSLQTAAVVIQQPTRGQPLLLGGRLGRPARPALASSSHDGPRSRSSAGWRTTT